MPSVDLADTGWSVWTGQALWQPPGDRPRIGGEFVAAKHSNGDVLVSFSKASLTIFTAQVADTTWRLDFIERRPYGGNGKPPGRFVWFRLPEILDGGDAPDKWNLERPHDDELSMTNPSSGESITVVLD